MKKFFVLLLAAMVFTACSDSLSGDIDYSTLSIEELVTTGDGVDYLVRTAGTVDEAEVAKTIADKVLYVNRNDLFYLEKSWVQPEIYGASFGYLLLLDNQTLLVCSYAMPESCYMYDKKELKGDAYAALINEAANGEGASVVAYVENVLVVEYTDVYGRLTRQVVRIQNLRDKIVNDYLSTTEK